MSTYEAMQTKIANELGSPELASRIPGAILDAIEYHQSERLWFLECEATASTVASQANYAVPDDLLETDALTLTRDSIRVPLTQGTYAQYRDAAESTTLGKPECWAYYVDEYWLYPVPDQVDTLTVSYRASLTALSAGTDTNAWMTDGEELIRQWAKFQLTQDRSDARAPQYEAAAFRALENLTDKSHRKLRDRSMSVDRALTGGRGFNINTG